MNKRGNVYLRSTKLHAMKCTRNARCKCNELQGLTKSNDLSASFGAETSIRVCEMRSFNDVLDTAQYQTLLTILPSKTSKCMCVYACVIRVVEYRVGKMIEINVD